MEPDTMAAASCVDRRPSNHGLATPARGDTKLCTEMQLWRQSPGPSARCTDLGIVGSRVGEHEGAAHVLRAQVGIVELPHLLVFFVFNRLQGSPVQDEATVKDSCDRKRACNQLCCAERM